MILCGHNRSAIVYEVLGDLLSAGHIDNLGNHRTLAARAYLRASYNVGDSIWSRIEYRKLAQSMLNRKTKKALKIVEKVFVNDIGTGIKQFSSIKKNERSWRKQNQDLERAYYRRYLPDLDLP